HPGGHGANERKPRRGRPYVGHRPHHALPQAEGIRAGRRARRPIAPIRDAGTPLRVALDATYSTGRDLSGVGVYSRELMAALAAAHREARFRYCYRPHRLLRGLGERLPPNAGLAVLGEHWVPRADVFHALNQRLPLRRPRRTVVTFHDLFVLT